jgi:hypothetical protein
MVVKYGLKTIEQGGEKEEEMAAAKVVVVVQHSHSVSLSNCCRSNSEFFR